MLAEDCLPDAAEKADFGGVAVRKGSIAAFLANARVVADGAASAEARAEAARDIASLLPALHAVGLFEVMQPRDARVRALLAELTPDDA